MRGNIFGECNKLNDDLLIELHNFTNNKYKIVSRFSYLFPISFYKLRDVELNRENRFRILTEVERHLIISKIDRLEMI